MALGNFKKLVERKKMGEVLIERKLLTPEKLQTALQKASQSGQRLGQVLVAEKMVTELEITNALCEQFGLRYLDVGGITPPKEAIEKVPENIARQFNILPVAFRNGILVVAVHDPLNVNQIYTLQNTLLLSIEICLCTETLIRASINQCYGSSGGGGEGITKFIETASKEITNKRNPTLPNLKLVPPPAPKTTGDDQSIEGLLNKILEHSMRHRASDIHMEPTRENVRIRERIDGILHESNHLENEVYISITTRLKVLAQLDIAEKRKPQDGHFQITFGKNTVDFRISLLPTLFGEKTVIRVLDKSKQKVQLSELGLSAPMLSKLRPLLDKPYGMVLVTGPTGSGKTTTIYSMLHAINNMDRNIITIEDPVEYQIDVINQVQVNPKAGVTFASALRSILRQDPDTIMVGEIRDSETAEITARSALTGHLVISTLHTNNALSTVHRLIDMGVDASLIASSLLAIVSQQLIRCLCPKCKKPAPISEAEREQIGINLVPANATIYQPGGCSACNNMGYYGREAIFEILIMDKDTRPLIRIDPNPQLVEAAQRSGKYNPMRMHAVEKLLLGITSVDEVLKSSA